ncbi:YeeE/YedE family protein [Haloarcula onubensis]|uniref:YeeE/YedE family protein n=1 Tax=Haloarcula onubensis TaxID=2950539 RepID=A0ABU2FLM5_9EURY|nr:YeeE/YedE thiosulfate transporter family protein [Halomicroarcula sp. S3CR25-11]MDS0281670.1 YeeE/YedE family protein [Halomicroarcula sp. S3CR25-11]
MLAETLLPNGWLHYLLGGLLIGAGTVVVYATTGITAGASTFLESTLSYVSDRSRFQQFRFTSTRDWRVVFTLGIVLGGTIYGLAFGEFGWTTEVQWWRLLFGGVLVGVGTRLGKGCTSGHGVCGVGSLSETSLLNVATFVGIAIGTAQVVQALGVTP